MGLLAAAVVVLPSVLANAGPDVSLMEASAQIIDFALRSAVLPLNEYIENNYEEGKDNFVLIDEQNEKAIHFIKEWIEKPEEYKMYSVLFQGKEYQLLPEVLFAIIMNEFKQKRTLNRVLFYYLSFS